MTKVYIIDDDPLYLTIVSTKLWQAGFTVRTFQSVEECLPHLNDQPDIIVLDHNLKDTKTKGLDYIKTIKKHAHSAGIIYVTSETSRDVVNTAMAMGADMYLEKNKNLYESIQGDIRDLLKKKKAQRITFWSKLFQ